MAEKTWIATNICVNRFSYTLRTGESLFDTSGAYQIMLGARYNFTNNGDAVEDIPPKDFIKQITLDALPSDVLSALQILNEWLEEEIRLEEEM